MAKPAENLDARFDRFLRTRDGAELAAVFDGTAPELHRLALHLAGSAAEAEDLVQETYIHLLHHLDDYRSEGKFMGWLLAILATKSLQARNRRRHRDLAGQEPVDPAPDPPSQTQARELEERLARALRALPEPYGGVVRLHLQEQLAPGAIARSLRRNPSTVRSQLRRGLDLLRRSLPPALAPALVALPRETLTVIRNRVLEEAAALKVTAPAAGAGMLAITGIGKVLIMKKVVVATFAALVVAGVAGYLADPFGTASTHGDPSPGGTSIRAAGDRKGEGAATVDRRAGAGDPARREATGKPGGSWVVSGRARLGYRKPFPGAQIKVSLFAGYEVAGKPFRTLTTRAGRGGRFRIAFAPPRRTVTVVVEPAMAKARATRSERLVLFNQEPPDDLELSIYPLDRILQGQVVDEKGHGLGGACLQTYRHGPLHRCAPDGAFRVPVSSVEAALKTRAKAPGYAIKETIVSMPGKGDPPHVRIVLEPGATVRGKVLDSSGQPLAGARIRIWKCTDGFEEIRSDRKGNFVVDYVPKGGLFEVGPGKKGYFVSADKEGYLAAQVQFSFADRPVDVQLTLKKGAWIEGQVLDPAGRPVPGARIFLDDERGYGDPRVRARDEGEFRIDDIARGRHRVVAMADGFPPEVVAFVSMAGTRVEPDLLIQLEKPHRVGGLVTDGEGRPLAGVQVKAGLCWNKEFNRPGRPGGDLTHFLHIDRQCRTGTDGRFRIGELPSGSVVLWFHGKGYRDHLEWSVPVDRSDIPITLQAAAALAGRVIDGNTREPITSFRVEVLGMTGPTYSEPHRLLSRDERFENEDGRWRMEGAQKEGREYIIRLTSPGYGPHLARLSARVDARPDTNPFVLFPPQAIRGLVRDEATGLPVTGARVTLAGESVPHALLPAHARETQPRATSDGSGRFHLPQATVGKVSLHVTHPDYPDQVDGPFLLDPETPAYREIDLLQSTRITGQAVDGKGRPVAGARLWLLRLDKTGSEKSVGEARSDRQGRFGFRKGITAGRYRIRGSQNEGGGPYHVYRQEFEIDTRGRKEIRLEPPGDCTLKVTVRGLGEVKLLFMVKKAGKTPGSMYLCRVEKGGFELRGLAEGDYLVAPFDIKGTFESRARTVHLAKGKVKTVEIQLEPRRR